MALGTVPSRHQSTGTVALRAAGRSHPGRVRENNEDRFYADAERGIFIVVDGVGGQAGGETAAETAVLQLRTRLERQIGSPEERLREAITLANNEVYRLAQTNADWLGMACVLTAAIVDGEDLTIGHVGDSRLYKLRAGAIDKLTHDHSPIGEREDAGDLNELDAMRHPRRNEVYRDVGSTSHTPGDADFIEIVKARLEPDAAMIVCSDGLTDLVTSREIVETAIGHAGDPAAVADELIDRANQAGGKDNVTVIYVEGDAFAAAIPAGARAEPRAPAATVEPSPETTPASRGVQVATHLVALLLGIALGALALRYGPALLAPALPSIPIIAPAPGARTLVVRQAWAAEFATIGAALAAARPGDTVQVGPGNYREQIRLRDGVTVASEKPYAAVIRLPDLAVPAAAVIADGIRGARLIGFQIVGEPGRLQTGVLVQNSELELQDTRIGGAVETAVDLHGSAVMVLRANEIADNTGIGVRVRNGAAPWLLHNAIVRNGRQGATPRPGVLLDPGAAPVLVGNVVADNGGEGIAGVSPIDRAVLLRNNVFVADGRPNGRGALRVIGETSPRER